MAISKERIMPKNKGISALVLSKMGLYLFHTELSRCFSARQNNLWIEYLLPVISISIIIKILFYLCCFKCDCRNDMIMPYSEGIRTVPGVYPGHSQSGTPKRLWPRCFFLSDSLKKGRCHCGLCLLLCTMILFCRCACSSHLFFRLRYQCRREKNSAIKSAPI